MKKMKRMAAAVAALAMTAALALPMTASMTAYAGSISFSTNDAKGDGVGADHEYAVYRIFKGKDVSSPATDGFGNGGKAQLNGITWAKPDASEAFIKELAKWTIAGTSDKPFGALTGKETAAEVAAIIGALTDAQAKEFADYVIKNCKDYIEKIELTQATGSTITFADETPGYYLIEETELDVDAVTNYLLGVYDGESEITINVKTSAPRVVKKVQENVKSDTTNPTGWDYGENKPFAGEDKWNDVADYTKGEMVPFRIEATLPSELNEFKDYYIAFHDHLDAGFKLPETIKVKIGGTDYTFTKGDGTSEITYNCTSPTTPGFSGKKTITVKATGADETTGWNIDIEVEDVKSFGAGASDKVTVDYSAMLDGDALVSSNKLKQGNYNDVYLTYDNNPTTDGHEGEDEEQNTPKDGVVVYTYDIEVHKFDGVNKNEQDKGWLAGATFVLAQGAMSGDDNAGYTGKFFGKNTETGEYGWIDGKITGKSPNRNIENIDTEKTADNNWVIFTEETVAGEVSKFEGLDDGTYYLVELNAPAGYNLADPIEVTVKATTGNTQNADDIGAAAFGEDGRKAEELGDIKYVYTNSAAGGDDVVWVENNSGVSLPGTGGIGTTLFYVIGGTLVAGAGVTLITKKRMKKEEE